MKIAITADLHLGVTEARSISAMIEKMGEPDAVVLAGDLGTPSKNFQACLSLFKHFPNVCVLAGNHDLWNEDQAQNMALFDSVLPDIVRQFGMTWLEGENKIIERIAIVGSYLHYDYSAKDTTGPWANMPDEYFKLRKKEVNNDGRFLCGIDDKKFSKSIGDKFSERLQEANDGPIDKVVIVTHVPCLEAQITRKPHDVMWSLGTPYFGNLSHQRQIWDSRKVTHVVSGHSHVGVHRVLHRGQAPPIHVTNLDSDYHYPNFVTLEL